MYKISIKPSFLRAVRRLEPELREEVKEKVRLLSDHNNFAKLRVHKLHGKYARYWSFSVNYKIRIVFIFDPKNEIVLMDIGDHDIYK